MAAKRKPAAQMRKIRDLDEPMEVIHESHSPVTPPVEPTASEAPAKAVVNQAQEVTGEVEAPAAHQQTVDPLLQDGLSGVKTKVMNIRCQVNLDSIIVESAERYGLTTSSFLALSSLYLSQQPEDTVNTAWKLLRDVESMGSEDGTSPLRGFRHSPRFMAEILEPLTQNPIFAKNKSQAVKAAAAWLSAMDRAESDKVMFSMRIFDAKNDYALTENAHKKRK